MANTGQFSVIIPARNSGRTLGRVLEAVCASSLLPAEVIVVDDGSTDNTAEIARNFSCRVVPVALGRGPMQPRFKGAAAALFPLLVFLDSDVCVKPDTFGKLTAHFSDPGIHAVTGLLAAQAPVRRFASHYKNEYMNFIFRKKPRESDFLYGSLWAVRQRDLIIFEPVSEPFGSLVSDTEMGMRLRASGKRVLLDAGLEVEHLKEYGIAGLLKNDFVIPFMFARIFLRYGRQSDWTRKRGFSHASLAQTAATALAFFSLTGLTAFAFSGRFFFLTGSLLLGAAFFAYWRSFLARLFKTRGVVFGLKAALLEPFDAAAMFCGLCSGFVYSVFRPHREPSSRLAVAAA